MKKHIITVSKNVHLNTDKTNRQGIQLYQFEYCGNYVFSFKTRGIKPNIDENRRTRSEIKPLLNLILHFSFESQVCNLFD